MSETGAGVDRRSVAELRGRIALGPWFWPKQQNESDMQIALRLCPSGIPAPEPGETILAAVNEDGASLWALLNSIPPVAKTAPLGATARSEWKIALDVLPRALPFLWSSVPAVTPPPDLVCFGGSLPRLNRVVDPDLLDGDSFGLSFLLALASLALGVSVPSDTAALAVLLPDGALGPVASIGAKIEIVGRFAPRVERLLVVRENLDEAREIAWRYDLKLSQVGTAAEALSLVFPDLDQAIAAAVSDHARRRDLIDGLFRMAVAGRDQLLEWTPVRRAAALVLERLGDLNTDELQRLRFAHAVFSRRENQWVEMLIPDDAWLDSLPVPVRLEVVADVVQHSAHTATPPPEEAERLGRRYTVPVKDAHREHLKVMGALGRLFASQNRLAEALTIQRQAALAHYERFSYADVSHPLAEWFRLAGELGDLASFTEAVRIFEAIEQLGGFGEPSASYVAIGRAKALSHLGLTSARDPAPAMSRISRDLAIPSPLRNAAAKWLEGAPLTSSKTIPIEE